MKSIAAIVSGLMIFSFNAQAVEVGIGVKAGTLGAGVDLSLVLSKSVNARISLTSIDVDDIDETITVGDTGASGDIDAKMKADFGANALLLDWYVFDGTFHLTAGMLKNNGKVEFTGNLLSDVVIDGQALAVSDIGPITGSVSVGESYEPYLGLGWGRKAGRDGGLSLSIELGVALLDPEVDLNATVRGTSALTQVEVNTRIQNAENDINNDLSGFEVWPVLSFGLNYAF